MRLDNNIISLKADETRLKLGFDLESPIDFNNIVSAVKGLTLIEMPLSSKVSGMIFKSSTDKAVVVINSKKSYSECRIALGHELYHYYSNGLVKFVCPSSEILKKEDVEYDADMFSSYFLMPIGAFRKCFFNTCHGELNEKTLLYIEHYFGITREFLINRLINEKILNEQDANDYREQDVLWSSKINGFSTRIYEAKRSDDDIHVLGDYISTAKDLLDKGIISNSKYEELMLDAAREDIVFGRPSKDWYGCFYWYRLFIFVAMVKT